MKAIRTWVGMGGLTLSLLISMQSSFAGEKTEDKVKEKSQVSEPAIDELKKSGDRGIYSTEIETTVGAAGSAIISTPPAVGKPVIRTQTDNKGAGRLDARKPSLQPMSKSASYLIPSASNAAKVRPVTDKVKHDASSLSTVTHSAQSTVVEVSQNAESALVVTAKLNKSGASPKYKVGEKMTVDITASADCNVVVFDYDGGTLMQIFPNDYQQNGFLKSGESISIGGPDSPFDYEIGGKGGLEKIFVYAYPLAAANPLTVALSPINHSPFRSCPLTIDEYKDLVNSSRVFFSREVKIVPKTGVKPVSNKLAGCTPNKLELSFVVEPK